jgi:hypothetical protein
MSGDPPRHDPRLPILGELEERLRTGAAGLTFGPAAKPRHSRARVDRAEAAAERPRTGSARRGGLRVARRILVLVVPAGLAAATALAARSFVADAPDAPPRATAAVQLGAGAARGEQWEVFAARRGSQICHSLFVGEGLATGCTAVPRPRQLVLDGLRSPGARWAVGFTGGEVQRVTVRVGSRTTTVATRGSGSAGAGAARLPAGLRWFVVALPRTAGAGVAPVRVQPLDGAGRRLDGARVTCNAGGATAACARARDGG